MWTLSILVTMLLPPAGLAVLALLALVLFRGRLGRVVASLALAAMVALSLPVVAFALLATLDVPPEAPAGAEAPAAIVVLGGDVYSIPDPPGAEIGGLSLERVRAGAALQKRTGLPVLVSGGVVSGLPVTVGDLMAESMRNDFGVPVRWTESGSLTTWENARLSAPMLAEAGVKRVLLVTHAWHMRRSILSMRRFGIEATPAPVRRDPNLAPTRRNFLPSVSAWLLSFYALHEWVGMAYYSARQ